MKDWRDDWDVCELFFAWGVCTVIAIVTVLAVLGVYWLLGLFK